MFNNVIEMYGRVLSQVRQHIPNAVLVGGCLRDTFYGVEVKDLDFVVQMGDAADPNLAHPELYPLSPASRWLREIWPDKQWQYSNALVAYNNDGAVMRDVIKSRDETVNFIIVTDIPAYTNSFPDSISKLVFDGEQIHYANEWMVGHNTFHVFYRPNIGNVRLEKLQRKYPEWVFQRDRVEEEPQQQELAIEW